jgi:hypothetical protein
MRHGYYIQGRQQARKLPNGHMPEVVTVRSNGAHEQCDLIEMRKN